MSPGWFLTTWSSLLSKRESKKARISHFKQFHVHVSSEDWTSWYTDWETPAQSICIHCSHESHKITASPFRTFCSHTPLELQHEPQYCDGRVVCLYVSFIGLCSRVRKQSAARIAGVRWASCVTMLSRAVVAEQSKSSQSRCCASRFTSHCFTSEWGIVDCEQRHCVDAARRYCYCTA